MECDHKMEPRTIPMYLGMKKKRGGDLLRGKTCRLKLDHTKNRYITHYARRNIADKEMDLTLTIIEKYKGKLKLNDDSDLPRDLLCLWKDIDVHGIEKINIPGLAELNKILNIVIGGEYACFVCGLSDWFSHIELMAIAPEGTDVEKLIREQGFACMTHSLSDQVDDKPYLEIPRFDVENKNLHQVNIFGQEFKSEAVKENNTTKKVTDRKGSLLRLWVWEIRCIEKLERLYRNPLAYAK